jgi:hypothetical protein
MATTLMVDARACKAFTQQWKEINPSPSSNIDAKSQKQNPQVNELM